MSAELDVQTQLVQEISRYYADPLGHVMFSYPWNSGALMGRHGPQKWQRDFLNEVGAQVRERGFDGVTAVRPLQFSTSSGHGIGKSALVAWLIRWIMDTRPFAKGVVTANTVPQLRTKTWAELAKWHGMAITKHWYNLTSGQQLQYYNKDYRETWRVDGQTAKEENSESFAGLHAANSTPFYIFDEASGIPSKIFEVREGGMTDGEPMSFDFGNPTRNSGRFFENMQGKHSRRYRTKTIDSRDVEQTNKQLFEEWAKDYGEDSDFFKVRVKGQFPDASSLQFIPASSYDDNVGLEVAAMPTDPVIMGVDVARFGDDQSVIWIRRGRDADTENDFDHQIFQKSDLMQLSARVSEIAQKCNPDAVMVDGGGVGGGVVDRLRQLGVPNIIEINFGQKANEKGYRNMRAQMWGRMREALANGIRLPDMQDLRVDLTGLEYGFNLNNDIQLETKEAMKKRGLRSPDLADALALTFALPVYPTARDGYAGGNVSDDVGAYSPFD